MSIFTDNDCKDLDSKEKDKSDRRSIIIIAMFDQGFAAGWKMAVSESFRESLDIRLTDRIYEGINKKVWTQGNGFSFNEGATIYDTKLAYEAKWGDALKQIKVGVKVISSEPASTPRKRGQVKFNVMRPNSDFTSIQVTETFVTTQDEFVCLLQTGKFHPLKQNKLSKEFINLFST